MTTFREKMLLAVNDAGWSNESDLFLAGGKKALELVAQEMEFEGWLRSDPGEAVDPRVDISEMMLKRAKEIA